MLVLLLLVFVVESDLFLQSIVDLIKSLGVPIGLLDDCFQEDVSVGVTED